MEIKGKITHVLEPVTGTSEKGDWKKQTFVLLTEGEYPKQIAFDVFKDKIPAPKVNDIVSVSINLESREYSGKWYTNITAWKIETNVSAPPESSTEPLETDPLPF